MTRRRFVFLAGSIVPALLVAVPLLLGVRTAAQSLPGRLSDQEFWKLVTDFSEPDGTFRSDNLLSNEVWLQYVIPELLKTAKTGRVYMGVGPEQNFTYMTALKPSMAFIVDIRRGNLDLHLVYKALFEMSADRADFVSRLFSRKRPAGLTDKSSAEEIFGAFTSVEKSEALYTENLKAIQDHPRHQTRLRPLGDRSVGHRVRLQRVFHVRPAHSVRVDRRRIHRRRAAADVRRSDDRHRRGRRAAQLSRERSELQVPQGV